MNVLVIEDDRKIKAERIDDCLISLGHESDWAQNQQEANRLLVRTMRELGVTDALRNHHPLLDEIQLDRAQGAGAHGPVGRDLGKNPRLADQAHLDEPQQQEHHRGQDYRRFRFHLSRFAIQAGNFALGIVVFHRIPPMLSPGDNCASFVRLCQSGAWTQKIPIKPVGCPPGDGAIGHLDGGICPYHRCSFQP